MSSNVPLAIVGIGCRFPGDVNSPAEFWQMMCDNVSAIVPIPEERWDIRKFYDDNIDKPGKMYVKEAGFLQHKIEQFDPEFFNISPREAMTLDPQQRLLLEVTWEAIEDSGISLEQFQAKKTGVFVGGFCLDSKLLQLHPKNKESINSFTSAGITMSILSNRISHVFDFKGPSISIDTACSSSLVATHLACQSIWNQDAEIAIIGGVNVMMRPEYFVGMCKGRFLSKNARCYSFDSRADGYVRGEGCGIVIIKSYSEALNNGDRIYAIIRGTGVNQDGRTAGISLPNSEAQEKLIKAVYARAEVDPRQIDYVEAHGTGTQQGDYAEAMALHRVFVDKIDQKCLVGSVKTNIGHTEAAAGVAGLIKTALCLYHHAVPANLNFETPNEKIDFDNINICIPRKMEKLSPKKHTHFAGVNSFGYGGTNAHAILESMSVQIVSDKTFLAKKKLQWPVIYPLTSRHENALKLLVQQHNAILNHEDIQENNLIDILYSLCFRHTHHHYRQAIIANNINELKILFQKAIMGEVDSNIICNNELPGQKRLIFTYSGMGPQWWGMGQTMLKQNTVFADTVKKCDEIFQRYAGWSLLAAMQENAENSRISCANVAQPLNFVLQIGITEMLANWGIHPHCVIGHSVGEIAAAYVAGALSLEEALLVAYHRSRLQQTCTDRGGMLAANISSNYAQQLIIEYSDVSIAAINADSAVTFAGSLNSLEDLSNTLTKQNIFNRLLKVNIAYHSPQMDVIKDELLTSLANLKPQPTKIPLYSTVTGMIINGEEINADYWWRNVRQAVLFSAGMDSIIGSDFNSIIEIGPHPVTKNYIQERLEKSGNPGKVLHSFHREHPEEQMFYQLIADLYTLGHNIDWNSMLPEKGQFVSLPKYPWQRENYWLENDYSLSERIVESNRVFMAARLSHPTPTWEVELNEHFFPYLLDHHVQGNIIFAGAGFIEAGLQACMQINNEKNDLQFYTTCTLSNIQFHHFLSYQPDKIQKIVTEYYPENGEFVVSSGYVNNHQGWQKHATGKIIARQLKPTVVSLTDIKQRCNQNFEVSLIYHLLEKVGLTYGSTFRGLKEVWHSGQNEILAKVEIPDIQNEKSSYLLHPAAIDAALHSIMALEEDLTDLPPYLPSTVGHLNFYQPLTKHFLAHIKILEKTSTIIRQHITLFSNDGQLLCEIYDFICQRLIQASSRISNATLQNLLYEEKWITSDTSLMASIEPSVHLIIFTPEINSITKMLVEEIAFYKFAYTIISETDIPENSLQHAFHIPLSKQEAIVIRLNKIAEKKIICIYIASSNFHYDKFAYTELLEECNRLTQITKLIDTATYLTAKLIIITQQAQIINPDDNKINLSASPLSSFGFLINNEIAKLTVKTIDIPDCINKNVCEQLTNEILLEDQATDIALRNNERYVMQLMQNNLTPMLHSLKDFDKAATYLITGGNSGFGLEIAKWLTEKGAAKIVLVSRSGITSAYAKHTVSKLQRRGVEIIIKCFDVAEFDKLKNLISEIEGGDYPLRGIFHCAMILDDGLLKDMTLERYEKVMKPKILGAIHLHEATKRQELNYFVMMSSIASLLGNVGQANYVAANAFLDSFAQYRRAQQLPATTLNLGILAEIGVIARSEELTRYVDLLSIKKTSVKNMLQLLEMVLANHLTHTGVFDFEWIKWEKTSPKAAASLRFSEILNKERAKTTQQEITHGQHILTILGDNDNEAIELLIVLIREGVAHILRKDANKIDNNHNLNNMGLDSLMVVELRNYLISQFDVEINLVELLKGISIKEIANIVLSKLKSENLMELA